MRRTFEALAAGILIIASAGITMAARSTTSFIATPFMTALGTDRLGCDAVNVGTVPLSLLKVELVNAADIVESTMTCASPVNPSDGCSTPAVGVATGYCRITFSGSSSSVRGSVWLMDSGFNIKVAVPA